MKVDADGKLLSRNGDTAVKTMPSLAKVALASSLPDATLMALDEITVHSDKGYTLQIKVHGFSRVPVLNSRCGNVVHFYTAWKGKVTLDSTDLSFDEATAAEFKNAGFSLATGGRRLAGKVTVDGFAKALDGMKGAGKWTCADVPLPTFSELGDRKETNYDVCGTKDDKTSICYSKYGGLKIGVTTLEGGLASAVTSKTDRMKGEQTESLFVKSSSSVMNSELYRVSFSEYPSHPGQQLATISDLKSGKEVRFQMESDKSRSHCAVQDDDNQKTNHEAQKKSNLDSDWHFEYMGTNEEDGHVLRHFRIMLSSEFTNFVFGDASKASLLNFAEFWDVAETMQPERLILGDGSITVFESYTQGITDADVQAAVRARTGKTVAELMVCSDQEATTKTDRPEMVLFGDLSPQDADYYAASSATKSETLSKYLDDATGNSRAMPDICYEKCKTAVDAVVTRDTSDICQGTALASALQCLDETGIVACSSSVFSNQHVGECQSNATVRTLQESEETEDAEELLVNDTLKSVSASRSLLLNGKCPSPVAGTFVMIMVMPTEWGAALCVKFTKTTKKGQAKNGRNSWKNRKASSGEKGVAEQGFILEFGYIKRQDGRWRGVASTSAIWIKLQFCVDLGLLFGLPPPLFCEVCIGGSITFDWEAKCPQVSGVTIEGKAWIVFEIGLDCWICRITFAALELGFAAGMGWAKITTSCWWQHNEGGGWRRRWWDRRRRSTRHCNYKDACDIYVKGWIQLTILIVRAKVEFVYWCKNKILDIWLRLYAWGWKWWEVYSTIVYRRDYN
jgi:hypothetical protein